MKWLKQCMEAGRVPASFLLAHMLLLGGCGTEVPSSAVTTGLILDCQVFQSTVAGVGVNRIFDTNIGGATCSASNCHSFTEPSPGGSFKVYRDAQLNSPEMEHNYYAAIGAATNLAQPANNKLLLEPLDSNEPIASGHGGGIIFPNTLDPNYVTILAWISTPVTRSSSCPP